MACTNIPTLFPWLQPGNLPCSSLGGCCLRGRGAVAA